MLKKCAFNFDLKVFKDGDFLISKGKLFHSLGAAHANARSPNIILFCIMGFARIEYLGSYASCEYVYEF